MELRKLFGDRDKNRRPTIVESRIRAAQISQLYSQSLPGLVGAILSAVVLTAALRQAVPWSHLLTWLGCYTVAQLPRYGLIAGFRKARPVGDAAAVWGKWFGITTVASGLIWGLAGIFLYPKDSLVHQFLIALFLTGIASAAAVVYSPSLPTCVLTVLAELCPLSGRFLYEGDDVHVVMGTVIPLFALVLVMTGKSVHQLHADSLRLGFENSDLVDSLILQNTTSDELNRCLKEEIGERQKAEESLKASLDEKVVLLREIHHRVKNNLQVISSLLRLQSRHIRDEHYKLMFLESQNRLEAMVLIHELLYRSKDLAKIDLNGYIKSLVNLLPSSFGIGRGQVQFTTEVAPVSMSVDTAIPCGLITNELVSNCLKHAFPDGRSGTVRILLGSSDNTFQLIVSDNGVGLSPDLDFQSAQTLGLRLVNTLVKQLQGDLQIRRSGGTEFAIEFREISSARPS
ncbi:MAG: hypothetical protein HY913_05615 [Desulfomonile tiedjei]|nr:hypothetical protein [Desulfomonile tiedjei]